MADLESATIPVVWDMETGDPDDFLTLILLAGHPRVDLKAVTITPGSPAQVGVVRHALELLELDVPVGAHNIDHPKDSVSPWHYRVLGEVPPSREAVPGGELLHQCCDASTTLVTGAPLKNLGEAIRLGEERGRPFELGRLFAQGGFAGEGVVPAARQLAKFRGLSDCATWNLNGAPKAAFAALSCTGIGHRWFVSKNVCHGVVYDAELHRRVTLAKDHSPALFMIWHLMDQYLQRRPGGKKFHDPLAACCAIDPGIGTWAEVEMFRRQDRWGCTPEPGSSTSIIVDYDHERFITVLTAS